jgi:hypothetical protein
MARLSAAFGELMKMSVLERIKGLGPEGIQRGTGNCTSSCYLSARVLRGNNGPGRSKPKP